MVMGSLLAIGWLALAGYMTLTLRVMWDVDLRLKLPAQLRADRGTRDTWSEGPGVLLLGTTAYLAVMAALLRQLHCAPHRRAGFGARRRGQERGRTARFADASPLGRRRGPGASDDGDRVLDDWLTYFPGRTSDCVAS